jgi:hypothetical protein
MFDVGHLDSKLRILPETWSSKLCKFAIFLKNAGNQIGRVRQYSAGIGGTIGGIKMATSVL